MTKTGAYWQLSREQQAWIRALLTRERLSFEPVADVLAEAVQYGAGLAAPDAAPSGEAGRRRAAERYFKGS